MAGQYSIIVALGLTVFSSILILLRKIFWHPLSQFPGPILPATTSLYQFSKFWTHQEGQWYRQLHQKYGPVVRCGPNHLSINEPEWIPIVYHRKADKTDFHQEFSCPTATFNRKDHVDHTAAKRRFSFVVNCLPVFPGYTKHSSYSLNRIKLFEHTLDEQICKWMALLQEQARQDVLVDWERWARYFSFDAITAVSFGEPTGFLTAQGDVRGLVENMDKAMYRQKISFYPHLAWFARATALGRRIFVSRRTDTQGLGLFMAEIHNEVQKRSVSSDEKQSDPTSGQSTLDWWLTARNSTGESIPVQEIEDQLLMDMLAGPDSISLMTTNLVFLLAARPSILKRAQREVDETFQTRDISVTWPEYDECKSLPFLDACVREGLRFVASSFPRRRCSPEGSAFYLDGKFVPAGTSVSSSACEIGRHRKLYGDDADEFNPDRWLLATPEQLRLWGTLDVHWGFGVRKCLGKHIGSMVLYKALVQVNSSDLISSV
ncbi:MAG: hypothetical protein Q9202_006373 [Teloschistes flavicans]